MPDPLLTQNGIGAGRSGRKQRKIRRTNGAKKRKSEPKQLRFSLETTYGSEGRGANPSRRTKSPRNRLISRTFAFHMRNVSLSFSHLGKEQPKKADARLCGVKPFVGFSLLSNKPRRRRRFAQQIEGAPKRKRTCSASPLPFCRVSTEKMPPSKPCAAMVSAVILLFDSQDHP